MKLVISKSIVNSFITRVGQLGVKWAVELESTTGKEIASSGNNPLADLPLFHKIENVVSKAVTVTRGESEVTVDINDQFINEYIDLTFKTYESFVKPMINLGVVLKDASKLSSEFQKKWQDDVISMPDPVDSVDPLDFVKNETECSNSKELYGWTLTNEDKYTYITNRILDKDTLDDVVEVQSLTATRGATKLDVSVNYVQHLCTSEYTLKETATKYGFPVTLVKAVREYYGFKPLSDDDIIQE